MNSILLILEGAVIKLVALTCTESPPVIDTVISPEVEQVGVLEERVVLQVTVTNDELKPFRGHKCKLSIEFLVVEWVISKDRQSELVPKGHPVHWFECYGIVDIGEVTIILRILDVSIQVGVEFKPGKCVAITASLESLGDTGANNIPV